MSDPARTKTPPKRYLLEMATHAPPPNAPWVELRFEGGRPYKFAEQWEADQALEKLQRRQPHVTYRVRDLGP